MPSFLPTTGTGCYCSALALQHTALVVLHLLYLHRTAPQCSPHTCYTGEQLKLKHTGIATFATSASHWCTARHCCYMCNAPQCFAHTYYTTVYQLQYNTTYCHIWYDGLTQFYPWRLLSIHYPCLGDRKIGHSIPYDIKSRKNKSNQFPAFTDLTIH